MDPPPTSPNGSPITGGGSSKGKGDNMYPTRLPEGPDERRTQTAPIDSPTAATERRSRVRPPSTTAPLATTHPRSEQKEYDMEFDGKTVLVTGATSGIGREAAKAFAARGARVIITGRDVQRAKSVLAEIDNDSAVFLPADLSSHEAVQRLIGDAGPADVLINDAGYWELGATAETSQS